MVAIFLGNRAVKPFLLPIMISYFGWVYVLMLDENIENVMSRVKAGRIDFILFKPFRFEPVQKTVQYFIGTGGDDKQAF